MKRLSQCMIVKNEEENIRRALSWGAGVVDEQIVVDTGSTDRTAEIAREMGAKVYHFPWTDDFSAAKNFALSKAEGQWIAFLDADEYVREEDVSRIPEVLKQISHARTDGIMVSMMQLDSHGEASSGGTQVRFFPNRPDLRYRRRIHEQLVRADGRSLRLADGTQLLTVFHTGYAEIGDLQERKFERNIQLVYKELEEHPKDYEMLGYLGDVYYGAEKWEEAEEAYLKALEVMPMQLRDGDQRSAVTFLKLFQIWDQKDVPEQDMKKLYKEALERRELQGDADFDYLMARWYLKRNRYPEALPHLLQAIQKLEEYGTFGKALYASAHLLEIYEQIAICQKHAGNLSEAVRQSTAILQTNPWSMTALCVLLESFQGGGVSAAQADQFLNKIYDRSSPKAKLFLLRSVESVNWLELEVLLRNYLSPEELEVLDRS